MSGGTSLSSSMRAPGDVAGIDRLRVAAGYCSRTVERTPSAPTSRSPRRARAVGEDRGDALGVLLDAHERHAETIALVRQRIAQRAIEPRPAAHGARGRPLAGRLAPARSRQRQRVDLDPHRVVEIDADAAQDVDELLDACRGRRRGRSDPRRCARTRRRPSRCCAADARRAARRASRRSRGREACYAPRLVEGHVGERLATNVQRARSAPPSPRRTPSPTISSSWPGL